MQYLAILGRQPELGLAELESIYGSDAIKPWGKMSALIDTEPDINRLGGTQKIGRVIYNGPTRDINEAPIDINQLKKPSGKLTFGLSYYGINASQRFVVASGITMKKRLRGGGSVRYVAPQTGLALGAAQVKFNSLIAGGFEILIAVNKQKMVVAITAQIQDIDWYAVRDFQRPTRSAKIGMLPPKLAQIMVNTTSAPAVFDPFCGTGVILQEALLTGRSAYGSDASQEMVDASTNNLEWLKTKKVVTLPWEVKLADARSVKLPKVRISIVSEGYLGPNLSTTIDAKYYTKLVDELMPLYQDSLANWAAQLEADSEITLTSPVWRTQKGWRTLPIIDQLSDLGYTIKRFTHLDGEKLIYRRPDQNVGRQLLILRKT